MKNKKKQVFSREPEGSLQSIVKMMTREELLEVLELDDSWFKLPPYKHQLATFALGLSHKRFLFANDMGTGKSAVAIYLSKYRIERKYVKQVLVTCPASVIHHWGKQVKEHSELSVSVVDGESEDKQDIFFNSQSDIVVVSIDWLVRQFTKAKEDLGFSDFFVARIRDFQQLIIDESHRLKNPSTLTFNGICEYCFNIPYIYLLTGTPVGNDYKGVWSQYYLLDAGQTYFTSYSKFLNYYYIKQMIQKGRAYYPIYFLRNDRKQELLDNFWNLAARWEESECNDLPDKNYKEVPLKLSQSQDKLYNSLILDILDNPESKVTRWDLMRVTSNTYSHSPLKENNIKLDALVDIVKDLLEANKQVVIWHWLNAEGQLIVNELKKKFKGVKIGEFRSDVSSTKKKTYLEKWHNKKLDIIVANPASLGVGVDLYEASTAIYFSNSPSLIDRRQSEKRIHRTGQTQHCYFIDLYMEGTIDQMVLEKLKNLQDAFSELTLDSEIAKQSSGVKPKKKFRRRRKAA